MTGMYAAIAVLGALARRSETGQGDYIDISMLDVMVGSLANQAMNYLISGKAPQRAGNKHPNIQPQDVFACRDGYVVLVVGNDGQFAKFCDAIGRPGLAKDPRFISNGDRVEHQQVLLPLIREIFKQDDMAAWSQRLEAAGVPCTPINTVPDVLNDPQVTHRNMLMHMTHPIADRLPQIASPMRFQDAPLTYERAPPLLGEHSAEILAELAARKS
jgi:crotonobetainyl-CoA:carnitine CoA-transferase CaiB-like acyl-CoA transferase